MRNSLKLAAFVLLIGLVVVLLLAVMSDYANGGDYTVTRSTVIESQRPIWLLITVAGMGVLNGRDQRARGGWLEGVGSVDTSLRIDGSPAPGIRGVARAGWRLLGFLLWDASGRIERITDLQFRGRSVRIVDAVSNGRVWVRVVVGPPLGDPRVRYAVLELEASEHERGSRIYSDLVGLVGRGTRIDLQCSAVLDLPGDRCRLVRRIARRIAEGEAGSELRSRVDDLERVGRRSVDDGHRKIQAIVGEFLRRVCR